MTTKVDNRVHEAGQRVQGEHCGQDFTGTVLRDAHRGLITTDIWFTEVELDEPIRELGESACFITVATLRGGDVVPKDRGSFLNGRLEIENLDDEQCCAEYVDHGTHKFHSVDCPALPEPGSAEADGITA